MDFAAAGLLDGLEGRERADRLELLERLASEGVSLEELQAAVAEDRLVLLPVERVLGGRYTADEVAERSGVSAEQLIRVRRALGFPSVDRTDRVWSEDDEAAAKSLKVILDAGMPEEAVLEVSRVLGEGMSRLSSTIAGTFADTYLHPGDSEREVALRYAAMARELLPLVSPMLTAALGRHVHEAARRGIIGRAELERGRLTGEEHAVVCFADLVGFTSLSGEIGVEELGTLARQLADLAADIASPPVRLVKTIGDAAMFVSPEEAAQVAAALALVEEAEKADLPSLRAGIASGPVLNRAGDWYGRAVNLASRVTGVARPGSVLCTKEVHDAAEEAFEWSFAGRFRLKGVPDPQPLYRARPLGAEGTDPAARDARAKRNSGTGRGSVSSKRRRGDRRRKRGSS